MLTDNPFFILGVTPRDGKDVIAEVFEERTADGYYEESVLMQTQKNLLTSKARLDAEIGWFPELAPKRAWEMVDILKNMMGPKSADKEKNQKRLLEIVTDLSGVSQANVAAYICAMQTSNFAALKILVQAQKDISVEPLKNAINANRQIAGFPEISNNLVEDALKALKDSYAKSALHQITAFEHPGNGMTQLVKEYSSGEINEKRFLEIIAERYDAWVIPKLRDFEDKIDHLITKAQKSKKGYKKIVEDIIVLLREWDEYAQPSQLIFHAKGLDEPRSRKVFDKVRELVLWLANEQQEHPLSLALSKASKEIFSELPSIFNSLNEDIGTLENLVQQGKTQEDVEPLAIVIVDAIKDAKALANSLLKKEFGPNGNGIAGRLYQAFIAVVQKTKGYSHEEEPWQMLRRMAIFLNNDKEQPLAAQEIIMTLCSLNPPASVIPQLNADSEVMKGNLLSNELSAAIKKGKLRSATEIIEKLIALSKTDEDKQDWRKMLATLKEQQKEKRTDWIVWGVIILALIGLSEWESPKSSSDSSNTTSYSKNNYVQDKSEAPPALGSKSVALSVNELRWCLYQEKRMSFIADQFPKNESDSDYIRLHNASLINQATSDLYDALVADFNSRCYQASYQVSTKGIIDSELTDPAVAQSINESAKDIMKTWNKGFIFKE